MQLTSWPQELQQGSHDPHPNTYPIRQKMTRATGDKVPRGQRMERMLSIQKYCTGGLDSGRSLDAQKTWKEGPVWTMARGGKVGRPTPVVSLLPGSFLCLALSSAGSSIRFPAPCSPGGSPELVAPWPLQFRGLLPWRGSLRVVFTAGTQGGCEPGLSAEQGLWKEEGRGWMFEQLGWSCHPCSGLGLQCPFLPGGLPVELSVTGALWLEGVFRPQTDRLPRESVLCVPLSGSVGRMCRRTGRSVPWGSTEAWAGDPAPAQHNDTELIRSYS